MSLSSTPGQVAQTPWDPFEPIIRALYLEQDMSLAEVMREMTNRYQFNATKSQYELQFKKWQFRKNCTANEWNIVARKLTKRKRENKESQVFLNGNLINAKKLRKETLRYNFPSNAMQTCSPVPSPPTPEGFIIRTPSPSFTTSMSILNANPLIDTNPVLLDYLPFHQFDCRFSQAENVYLFGPETIGFDSTALSEHSYFYMIGGLKVGNNENASRSLSDTIKAILPENIFPSSPTAEDMTISPRQPSSVIKFLKLSMYLISNNFFGSTTDVSKKVYRWVKVHSNAGLLEYILSIGGPTVEALAENLFRLALDAEDVRTIEKMVKSGIDPNEQVYRDECGNCSTPLNRACAMRNLNLVKVLLEGGAKVGESVGKHDTASVLMSAVNGRDENYESKEEYVDPELVKILLNAGAIVNPGSGESPLHSAVECGNVEVVNLLVSAGADVNFVTKEEDGDYSYTPLIKAIDCEADITDGASISMVRTLLLAGADPQGGYVYVYEGEIETPLEAAMKSKSIELIQLLLNNGARVNEDSLARAVRTCNIEIVKLLLDSGGQVTESVIESAVASYSPLTLFLLEATKNRMKSLCYTAALTKSIECGKMALIQKLSAQGAQLSKSSKLEEAIKKVITTGNVEVLNFILDEKSGYRALSLESIGTGLQAAIHNNRNDIVELLLRTGANVNVNSYSLHGSPLSEAIKKKDSQIAEQLLLAGAAVNGMDANGNKTSVLPVAVDWGYYPLIHDIIRAGAEIDAPEERGGRTALFLAVEKKSKKVIKLLIDAGANVNAPEAVLNGQTALLAASRNVDLPMARYLLELGADSDEWSLTVAIACSIELVQLLLEARLQKYKRYSRGYGCGALQHAIRLKDAAMIKLLFTKGVDPNIILNKKVGDVIKSPRNSQPQITPFIEAGQSALGFAIKSDKSKDSEIVRLLLHNGADPNSIVTNGHQTALLACIDEGNLGLVKLLMAAGADANPSLRFGVQRTPLQLAAEKGRIDVVSVLLENGADINTPPYERYGATALQFAAIGGYIGIAMLLIQQGADVNAPSATIGGRTALEGAAEHGRIDMLQLLLSAGALVVGNGVKQYNRARELAVENGHRAACRLLEKYSADMLESFNEWEQMFTNFGPLENSFQSKLQ